MAAARYWRIVGVETYAGGDLELSALHLYAGATRVDGAAALTCSHTPITGTLAGIQDADTATTCRFAGGAVRSGGFSLTWDFGAGSSEDIWALRPGGGGSRASFMAGCTLQSSTDAKTWVYAGVFGQYRWPGANTMSVEPAPGGDAEYAKVALLLHMDGDNGSTTFTDSSSTPKIVTAYNGAKISTANSKFGGSAFYFSGPTSHARITPTADFAFGTGDFTMECWVNYSAHSGARPIALFNGAYGVVQIYISGGALGVETNNANGGVGGSVPLNAWTHLAVSRQSGVVRTFINGVKAYQYTDTGPLATPSNVNVNQYGNGDGYGGTGYVDEVRITKGLARYTGDFSPPSAPFPSSAFATGGIIFETPALHTVRGDIDIAASAPVPAFNTRSPARLQLARDIEFGGAGTIYGTTKTKGTPNVPTKARVVLLHQRSKLLVRETWSDPVTGAFAFTGIDINQQFITLAEDATGNFRPVAASRLTPEVAP